MSPRPLPSRPRFVRLIAVPIAVIALALAGCTAEEGTDDSEWTFSDAPVSWAACAGDDAVIDGLECATYEVPLDYADAGGETISLALRRMPAASGESQGTLFFNPGGPGGTGSGQFPAWYELFPQTVRDAFDLVSWDPRGVGESTAVQCYPDADAEGEVIGPVGDFPLTFDEQQAWNEAYAELGEACASNAGDLAAHVSTGDTARDLEQLRRATGGEPLNYWGVSYGTFLGMTYANMFPDQIRSFVLDGNLSPQNWTNDGDPDAQQTLGVRIGSLDNAEVLDQFFVLCATAGPDQCAFAGPTVQQTRQKWTDLQNILAAGPVTFSSAAGPRTITLTDLVTDVDNGMDVSAPIPGAQGWVGTATALQTIYEAATNPAPAPAQPDGDASSDAAPEPPATTYVGPEQALSIACGDAAAVAPERIPTLAVEVQQQAGYSGLATLYFDVPCSFWQVKAADPYTGPWRVKTSQPALVVNTTHDPSTPYKNAVQNSDLLEGSVLLTVNGYGHTSLLNRSTCADDLIAAYILDGTLPEAGTFCAQDKQPFQQ